jgi:hypothetical protein
MNPGRSNRPMFRFTIRDVLWLMVVAAIAMGWLVDNRIKTASYSFLLNRYREILPYAPPEYRARFPSTYPDPATLNDP